MRLSILSSLLLVCVFTFAVRNTPAQLKAGQARSLITRVAGSEFPSNAVRVKLVTQGAPNIAQATAELETAFRLEQNANGQWRVRDIRIGQERWEDVGIFWSSPSQSVEASESEIIHASKCDVTGAGLSAPPAADLNVKRARCLLAELMGVDLPSDAVRIREVSPLTLPLSSSPSAVVVAVIRVDFGFEKQGKESWRVVALRTGTRDWANVDELRSSATEAKKRRAQADLRLIADALARFRAEQGFYVATDKHQVLIDHLAPHYLHRVVRFDPWHKPYEYKGERDHFTLRSAGPDGKPNTPDDLVLSSD